ncbi:hypothetical protein N658DRAFT_531771 [Parathielavia hyrcaniae]|uniref:Uncharacterized protein n=1 Tax=Parathielavia hyrcaniae TaxID=113614 RepID=A0AAN6Q147_9PEZI|nr:hypothetical protein N658DRAFT_531771 [Parathielavia hyrcaniae]
MTRPMLLALLCAAVGGWMVDAWPAMPRGPDRSFGRQAEHLVEPNHSRGPPWFSQGATTTITTTLTFLVPGPTSQSSPIPSVSLSWTTQSGSTTPPPSPPPDVGSSQPLSSGDRQTSSEAQLTDTMPADITTTSTIGPSQPTTPSILEPPSSDGESGIGSNRTLTVTLSTVFSAVGLAMIAGIVLLCYRRRRHHHHRLPFLSRGVSPIDDDEIERWKSPRDEKARFPRGDTTTDLEADDYDEAAAAALHKETEGNHRPSRPPPRHAKHFSTSTSSLRKPPSVIVYSSRSHDATTAARHSTDAESRRSFAQNYMYGGGGGGAKTSFDNNNNNNISKNLPQTPIQARAPNARAGLTDESVPGDEPFILTSPKRTPSRLSKLPPHHHHHHSASASVASVLGGIGVGGGGGRRAAHHARARSSRSSTRSFGEYYYYGGGGIGGSGLASAAGSELELSARHSSSHDQLAGAAGGGGGSSPRNFGGSGGGSGSATSSSSHSRVYSSSSVPPRPSFGDEVLLFGGLSSSPARSRFVGDGGGEGEIGRAIG